MRPILHFNPFYWNNLIYILVSHNIQINHIILINVLKINYNYCNEQESSRPVYQILCKMFSQMLILLAIKVCFGIASHVTMSWKYLRIDKQSRRSVFLHDYGKVIRCHLSKLNGVVLFARSSHQMLNRCRANAGRASETLAQHCPGVSFYDSLL